MSRTWSVLLLGLLLSLATSCGERAPDEGRADGSAATFGDGYGGLDDGEATSDVDHPVPDDAPRVVVLGDSLAAGLHLPVSLAWPAQLARRLAHEGLPVHMQNAGVSGDTTAGGRSRLAWLLRAQPDIVVVELGGNDGLRGQPVREIEANLRAILQGVLDAGARPVLVAMRIPTNYGPAYTSEFAAVYPRLAAELDVPLVADFLDGVGGEVSMNLSDGLHPNADGHRRLAENALDEVAASVRALLGERAESAVR